MTAIKTTNYYVIPSFKKSSRKKIEKCSRKRTEIALIYVCFIILDITIVLLHGQTLFIIFQRKKTPIKLKSLEKHPSDIGSASLPWSVILTDNAKPFFTEDSELVSFISRK